MKKFTTRFLTVFLAISILIASLPMSVFAAEFNELLQDNGESVPVGENSAESTEEKEVYALGEDTALRTAKSKHIRMSDGSYYAAMYANDVHFLNDEGEWEEIDNTLIASNASGNDDVSGVATTGGKISVKFANSGNSSKLVAIKTDDYKISFGLVGANSAKGVTVNNPEPHAEDASALDRIIQVKKAVSSVIYNDILENTDLEYIVSGNRIKENIIVKEKSDSYVYEFDMKLNKLTAETASDGTIVLKDEKSGESVFVIDLPYMYDENGETSNAVTYSLEQTKNKEYRITVTADSAWMNDESRAYPVTIDPPIEIQGESSTRDTYADEANPNSNYGSSDYISVGYDQNKSKYGFLQIDQLSDIPKNAIITNASLEMCVKSISVSGIYIGIYEQGTSWSETGLNWSNKGSSNGTLVDYQKIDNANYTVVGWDITALAQKWYRGSANNGVLLKKIETGSTNTAGVVTFQSSEFYLVGPYIAPIFTVVYRNIVGLESYYTYQTQSVGRAGTGNINHYNSNLTLTRGILSSASESMPFSLSHVYNSANANLDFANNVSEGIHSVDFSKMKVGKGWKLSVQETLVTKTIGGKTYLVYNDADGTEHYFKPISDSASVTEWEDEDGMNLTVTLNTATGQYTMTNKGDDKRIFTNGILTQIVDANGNQINFVYNTNNQLTSITRLNKEGVAETLASFSYNSSDYLTSVTDAYGRTTNITYNASKFVTTVTFPDGSKANYAYTSSGKMKEAYSSDANYGILYTVSTVSGVGETITMVQEFYKSNSTTKVYGNKFNIDLNLGYRSNYTDYGADGLLGTADDVVTTYRFDRMGRTITAYSTDDDRMTVYGANATGYTAETGATANRVSSSAVTGIMPKNYVTNSSMEQTGTWTLGNASYVSTRARTGVRSVKLNSASGTRYVSQTVSLPDAEIYTVSAYVDVSALSGYAYIEVTDTYDDTVWSGEILSKNDLTASDGSWQRITCTFEPTDGWGGDFEISVNATGTGVAYVDDVQVEAFAAPSNYNLLGDLSRWTMSGNRSYVSTYNTSYGSTPSIYMTGSPTAAVYATTTVPINRPSDTTFMFSAWASGTSVPTGDFALHATINYADLTTETTSMSFQKGITIGEQFLTATIVPKKASQTVESITLKLSFTGNSGSVHFYNPALVEECVQTYFYDDEGNLTAANQSESESISSSYDDLDNLISQEQGNEKYEYTYKSEGNQHLVETVTSDGVTMTFTYDSAGNVTGTVITAQGTTNQMSSGSTYSADKNFVLSSTDTSNSTTYYTYDAYDRLSYTKNAKGARVYLSYNDLNDRKVRSYIDGVVSASYEYLNGALSTITRTGTANGTSKTQTYTFERDGFGNVTQIKVGTDVLVSYEYAANNGHLTKTTYGNGTVIENVYDVLDRIVQIKYNDHIRYKYSYNGNGDLCEIEDRYTDTRYRYEYDSLDRPCALYTYVGDSIRMVSDYTYDGKSRVTEYTCGMVGATGGNLAHAYGYTYDDASGTMSSMTVTASGVSDTMSFTYDPLQRLTAKNTVRTGLTLAQTYAYKTISGNRTSTLISGLTQKINGSTTDSYTYTYDSLGNITAINRNGTGSSYVYDVQNQLTVSTEGYISYQYTYDTYGNILSVKKYDNEDEPILLSTDTYTYGNSQWLDRLTAFNGVSITYDGSGNPLSYYNGSSYTFTWNGRELATAVKGSTSISYKYGADGLRTQKTVGSTVYNYYYADGLLVRQTWGSNYIDFLYDESGSAYSFIYNGTQYYYVKNLQGDVVKILNTSGTTVVAYSYDAWGKCTVTSGASNAIANANPIRYRGYYYDTDTGFYYLQSRYYDPAIKRFINADDVGLLGANGDFTSLNLYAYCGNNPVARADESGEFWAAFTVGAILGGVGKVTDMLVNGELDLSNWRTYAKIGVATVGGGLSEAAGPIAGALISGVVSGIDSALSGNEVEQVITDAASGIITSSLITGAGNAAELIPGVISTKNFLNNASGAQLKQFANNLGYLGRNYKQSSKWTGKIVFDAAREFSENFPNKKLDKCIRKIVGYGATWGLDRLANLCA